MLRYLLTPRTFRIESRPDEQAEVVDPANRLHTHANVRRLEGEIIRDHLLAVGGQLERSCSVPGPSNRYRPTADPFIFESIGLRKVRCKPSSMCRCRPQRVGLAMSQRHRLKPSRS